MGHAAVDHLRLARSGTIAEAVVGGAEMRAALDHSAWDAELRQVRVVALLWRHDARIAGLIGGREEMKRLSSLRLAEACGAGSAPWWASAG